MLCHGAELVLDQTPAKPDIRASYAARGGGGGGGAYAPGAHLEFIPGLYSPVPTT